MVGRICVWRLLGTSDQSLYHWPSLVISYKETEIIWIQIYNSKVTTGIKKKRKEKYSTFQEVTPGIHFSPGRSAEQSASSNAPSNMKQESSQSL